MAPSEVWPSIERMVFKFGRNAGLDGDDLKDYVSDVYLRFATNWHKYDSKYKVTTWLWYICRSILKEHFRSKKREAKPLPYKDVKGYDPYPAADDRISFVESVRAAWIEASPEERFAMATIVLGVNRSEAAASVGESENWIQDQIAKWRIRINGI